jgi:hypothetical protein
MSLVLHAIAVGAVAGPWLLVLAVVAGALALSTPWRLIRRCVLRARWASVARSCGLAVTRDRRSKGGETHRVEYLPTIRWGRALPGGGGVHYRLRPARGGTIGDVAEAAERLAAGLHVHRVEVERIRADKGRMVAIWSDPLADTVKPAPAAQLRADPPEAIDADLHQQTAA